MDAPSSAVIDVKYGGRIHKIQLFPTTDPELEARSLINSVGLPEQFYPNLVAKFRQTIEKLIQMQQQAQATA